MELTVAKMATTKTILYFKSIKHIDLCVRHNDVPEEWTIGFPRNRIIENIGYDCIAVYY
jgi:hypothetical protein